MPKQVLRLLRACRAWAHPLFLFYLIAIYTEPCYKHTQPATGRATVTARRATAPLALRQTPQTQALSRQNTHAHVSHPRGALCMHMKESSARSARTRAGPRLLKARGRPRYWRGVGRARAGLGRELPARTGEPTGHTRRRATPSSAPRPPGRSRRGLEDAGGGAGRQAGRDGTLRCTRAPRSRVRARTPDPSAVRRVVDGD